MRYRAIASTDIEVSEVGFGVWTVSAGWWGNFSDTEAVTLLRQAFDRGVNFFDTADTYGNGRGETILAQAFPGADRDEIVVATKFGYDWESQIGQRREGHQEAPHCFEPAFMERALEGSLRRLGTDRIDCYQIHNARMEHLLNDDVWTFLDKAREAGKVRTVGIALGPAIGWLEEGLYAIRELPVEIVHTIYNALELDPGRALIEAAREHQKSLFVRVPHSSGMLEGAYTDRHGVRRERPSPPPPALVADQRAQEDRTARLPDRGHARHAGAGGAALHPQGRHHRQHLPQHLRPRPDRGVRRRV